jgi:hypothetical protein
MKRLKGGSGITKVAMFPTQAADIMKAIMPSRSPAHCFMTVSVHSRSGSLP